MEAFRQIRSRTAVLPYADIDTDQIIPARFLRTTTREGLGRQLFADWRFAADGTEIASFPLNRPEAAGCHVLVAGHNFGCGSSREHAAWALLDFGFRAVISTSIADIFRNNALKNGLLPLIVEEDIGSWLLAHPGAEVLIDLQTTVLELPEGRRVQFAIEPFARHCLLSGVDEFGYLLSKLPAIESYERARSAQQHTPVEGTGS